MANLDVLFGIGAATKTWSRIMRDLSPWIGKVWNIRKSLKWGDGISRIDIVFYQITETNSTVMMLSLLRI